MNEPYEHAFQGDQTIGDSMQLQMLMLHNPTCLWFWHGPVDSWMREFLLNSLTAAWPLEFTQGCSSNFQVGDLNNSFVLQGGPLAGIKWGCNPYKPQLPIYFQAFQKSVRAPMYN